MEELGVGGFMGVQDVRAGMKVSIAPNNAAGKKEYLGEVAERIDKNLYVTLEETGQVIVDKHEKHVLCQLRIVVDNVLYVWKDIEISLSAHGEAGKYKLSVENNPQVFNRRKYPRMPLANSCSVKLKGNEQNYPGKMVNISANGFAFATKEGIFAESKGKDIVVEVRNFELLGGRPLEGCIIRSSNNDGEYIIGCRMPEDSKEIKEYVSKNYSE